MTQEDEERKRDHLRPVGDRSSPVRLREFLQFTEDFKEDIRDLKRDHRDHIKQHDEEAQWRRRSLWINILAPVMVMVIGGLILYALLH